MKNEILYPKNIDNLYKKLEYIIDNDENIDRIQNMTKWLEWFKKLNMNPKINLKTNEYLRAYYSNNNCSLQVWIHGEVVDSASYDLIANYYGKYYCDTTIIVEM